MKHIMFIISIMIMLFSSVYASDTFVLSSVEEAKTLSQTTNKPLLLIFGSDSCGPCRSLKTDINTFLLPSIDGFIICYINIDNNPQIKTKYNISTIPDSRIFIEGSLKHTMIGYDKFSYEKWLNNVK